MTDRENILLVAKIGGVGFVPWRCNGSAGLSVADELLFVQDNLNARVPIDLINLGRKIMNPINIYKFGMKRKASLRS